MKFLERFSHYCGFSQNEGRIVLFLVITFVLGGILTTFEPFFKQKEKFNYSESDSVFFTRSQQSAMYDLSRDENLPTDLADKTAKSSRENLLLGAININTASKDELIRLPGVGEVTAERIIIYREEHGPFTTIEEIQNVKGIGKKKFERIAPYIKVN